MLYLKRSIAFFLTLFLGAAGITCSSSRVHSKDAELLQSELYLACFNGDLEGTKMALKKGAQTWMYCPKTFQRVPSTCEGRTPLTIALTMGHNDLARYLIEEIKDGVNYNDNWGAYPIHCARSPEMLEYLIRKGAKINMRNRQQNTPLMQRVRIGCLKSVQILIRSGAEVILQDADGHTALDFAQGLLSGVKKSKSLKKTERREKIRAFQSIIKELKKAGAAASKPYESSGFY